MRGIALLLIVANLGYLGWAALIDAPAQPQIAENTDLSQSPRLELATERAQSTTGKKPALRVAVAKPSATPTESASIAALQKCTSVGPFQDLPTVVEASAVLKGAGYESRQRLEQGELWVGYWVSIAGFAAHEQAERAIAQLKDKSITDAYILPGTDPPNVISLGVFKEHERAQRRMNEAKTLGFDAQIADRTRTGSVYWIDVDLKTPGQILDTSLLGSQPGKIVRLELRACPGATGG